MTSPTFARKARGGRYYEVGDERFWSVTTILGAVPKPALPYWSAREVATWAVDHLPEFSALAKTDRDAAIDLLKGAPWRSRSKAADVGSLVHAVAEAHALGEPPPTIPENALPLVAQFLRFLEDFDPSYAMAEATVANRTYRYAGTLDFVATIDGVPVLVDIKTGSGVYPEAALQLAAYRGAEFVLMSDGSEVAMPEIAGGAVLHLRPDAYALVPVRCDRVVFDVFLYVREVWRWQQQTSNGVLGNPVAPPEAEAS